MKNTLNLLNKIQKKNLEYLNSSFNKNRINAPKDTFYSAKMVNLFKKKTDNLNNINQNIYIEYMKFLKKELGIKSITIYFKELAKKWKNKDKKYPEDILYQYILKVFIINSIKGEIKERAVLNKVKELNIPFRNATFLEDSEMCIDLFIGVPGNEIGLQIKPDSFFNSLRTTSKNSLKKIKKAGKQYNNAIFLAKEKDGKVFVLVRGNDLTTKFIPLEKFKGILNYDKNQIYYVSRSVFSRL